MAEKWKRERDGGSAFEVGRERMSEAIVEVEDDEFLSQVDALEASALSSKRCKITTTTTATTTTSTNTTTPNSSLDEEGVYTAVLRGSRSILFQQQYSKPPMDAFASRSIDNNGGSGSGVGGGDSCFKCGNSGHWARDCGATSQSHSVVDPSVPEKPCSCGMGACLVLTAKTDKNCGRKFYKCPLREENGGCGFFEWCDKSSGTDNMSIRTQSYSSNPSSFPDLSCPCGAGSCLILTAKTGKSIGQQFYRCPASQGSCGFFKWCHDHTMAAGFSESVNSTKVCKDLQEMNSKNSGTSSSSSCFKCGKDGHWAKDCAQSSYPSDSGGKCGSSGTCYKCGKPGHWAKDCSSSADVRTRPG